MTSRRPLPRLVARGAREARELAGIAQVRLRRVRPAAERDDGAATAPSGDAPGDVDDHDAEPRVQVLTAALLHPSVGDEATLRSTLHLLAVEGIAAAAAPSPRSATSAHVVIGGGELLTRNPAVAGFLLEGPHLLNAVGARPDDGSRIDLGPVADYLMVTARDEPTAALLARHHADVGLVPCPATVGPAPAFDELCRWNAYRSLTALESGPYLVVHRHPALRAAMGRWPAKRVVVMDMQSWARRRWGVGGIELADPSPEVTRCIVGRATAVLTSSLHLAILAIGTARPVAVLDTRDSQAAKSRRYLQRAGLEALMSDDVHRLEHHALAHHDLVMEAAPRERALALAHGHHLASVLSAARHP